MLVYEGMTYYLRFLLLTLITFIPLGTSAQLEIREIMYDHEGSDTDREWIEIYNTGSTSVNVTQWFFKENDINHGINTEGDGVLEAQEYALIIQGEKIPSGIEDATLIFHSSFSLNNTGETIALVNPEKEVVDSISYTSELGASGDGNSLHRTEGGTWKSRVPSPGRGISSNQKDTKKESSDEDEDEDDNDDDKEEYFDPYYEPYITVSEQRIAGNEFEVKAGVYRVSVHGKVRKKSGFYYLNFGDGSSLSTRERIDETHIYQAPGTYIITLEFYNSSLSIKKEREPDILYQKIITVVDNDIKIVGVDGVGGVILKNKTNSIINIGGWTLHYPEGSYTFPPYTNLAPDQEVTIPYKVLGTVINLERISGSYLTNNLGRFVSRYTERVQKQQREVVQVHDEPAPIELGPTVVYADEENFFQKPKEEVSNQGISVEYILYGIGILVLLGGLRYLSSEIKKKKP